MILLDTDHLSVFTDERDARHALLNRRKEFPRAKSYRFAITGITLWPNLPWSPNFSRTHHCATLPPMSWALSFSFRISAAECNFTSKAFRPGFPIISLGNAAAGMNDEYGSNSSFGPAIFGRTATPRPVATGSFAGNTTGPTYHPALRWSSCAGTSGVVSTSGCCPCPLTMIGLQEASTDLESELPRATAFLVTVHRGKLAQL
jgi:hypothetical protein